MTMQISLIRSSQELHAKKLTLEGDVKSCFFTLVGSSVY